MDDQQFLDFISALGEEYFTIISPLCPHEVVPQDGYEVFLAVFGDALTPERLHATTEADSSNSSPPPAATRNPT